MRWALTQLSGERYVNDGAAYDPVSDTWTPISTTNAPEARWGHVAVWSSLGMIVWGGQATSGHPADLTLAGITSSAEDSAISPILRVPRDGVEPPTRGFSVRCSTS